MRLLSIPLLLAMTASASAVTLGQIDDFEDGTTQNWVANLLGLGGGHPAPPANVPDGGPLGAGDAYLGLTSFGGIGAGGRMVTLNITQWSGDYVAAGVTGLAMNLNNMGNTALDIRILIEKVGASGPTDIATSAPIHLEPGRGWTSANFSLALADLTTLLGDKSVALSSASAIRIYHNPGLGFPGPASAAQLGVDNIQAVPEPTTVVALVVGTVGLLRRRKR
ncbi:PEP-CTERM sorting domain-containing protein [bacterium]|nr:MAG: PEP-CTERM sorting domain-containing protein [bacterium]